MEKVLRHIPFVDLKTGFAPIKADIMKALESVLEDMRLYLGPHSREFEKEFARYCGTNDAVGVGSGTEALLFALLAVGIKSGDEVITTTHSFFATVEAIVAAGAIPVLVDIDPLTYTIDPGEIEKKITRKTRAIVPVHLYGQMADMDPIAEIARKRGISIVEDACQAHGALYRDKKAGSIGDAGCFSFYCTKNLGAYGEGGMVTTNDPALADRVRLYRNHGHRSKFEHAVFGYNGRLDEMQAAILRIKLKYLDENNARRRGAAERYDALLRETPLTLPQEAPLRSHVYHLYVVRSKKRDALRAFLEEKGVGTGIHYKKPIHLQEAARGLGYGSGNCPHAEAACDEILSLPMYPELDEESQEYIADCIKAFYGA